MSVDPINVSPRLSFSWSPLASEKTVISGGAGLFYDNPAAGAVDNLLGNPLAAVLFNIIPLDSSGAPSGILPFTQGPAAFAAAVDSAPKNGKSLNIIFTFPVLM